MIDPNDPRAVNQLQERIAPGIWVDRAGNIHFSITELLQQFDLPDNPAERAAVLRILKNLVHKQNPRGKIIMRENPDDPGTAVQ